MLVHRWAHLYVPFIICLLVIGMPMQTQSQNRVIAKVEPNKDKINDTAEIYDLASGAFSAAGTMLVARTGHTETRLANGKVLLTGGVNDVNYLNTAEIYDPVKKTFAETTKVDSTTSETVESLMNARRTGHTATLLRNGMVLIVGGYNGSYLNTAELFNPATGVFTLLSNTLNEARAFHTATLLPSGDVLITGGYNGSYLKTLELFSPYQHQFIAIGATTNDTRAHHTATLMSTGEVLIAGGINDSKNLSSAVIYTPSSQSSRTLANTLTVARFDHAAVSMPDGTVLIAGGSNGSPLAKAETYNPTTSTFKATVGQMTTARQGLTETLLANGKVLIAGGSNGNPVTTAELYNPSSGTFAATPGSMALPRQGHTATLLADGKVLLTGGQNGKLFVFDINLDTTDNISPNIIFSDDSTKGFVSYTGSGAVLVFSALTGEVLGSIETGGRPNYITPLPDGHTLAVVSVLDNRVFLIDMSSQRLVSTLTFTNAAFGYGSMVAASHTGNKGYISSTGTGEVIKFSFSDGKELGRLTGLQTPAQITLTPDDSTLIVVDTTTEEIVFASSAGMNKTNVLKATETDTAADFTIGNNVVLSPDGYSGIIASRGANSDGTYTAFIFKVSTGEILATETMTYVPGFTALTPDGNRWVILTQYNLFVVPVADPDSFEELAGQGEPLVSSNIVFSPDSRYVYYASATYDLFVKQDLTSVAIVGELGVGDDPNLREDQTSSVAVTPDSKTFAALNFTTNNIALIGSNTVLNSTRLESGIGKFTGLSLINPSLTAANVKITAMSDFGSAITGTDIINPVEFMLPPNGQLSTTVDQLFSFDGQTEQTGWLSIISDQPNLVGYVSFGRVKGTWLGSFIDRCDGSPLFGEPMYDWIIPDVSRQTGDTTELNFVNANHSSATFDLSLIVKDGSVIEKRTGTSISSGSRTTQSFATVYTQAQLNKVLIVGGENSTSALSSAEYYDPDGLIFTSTSGTLNRAVKSQMAALLPSGKVLTAGGRNSSNDILDKAEIYDPVSLTFTLTSGAMNTARYRGTATLLQDGRVLIAGGQTPQATSNTAETYNPSSDSFSLTAGVMTSSRSDHTATLLPNGYVLIAGGSDGNNFLDTAELYDPRIGTFTPTGTMTTKRAFHTATLLATGQVLIAGGYNGGYVNTAEVFDPSTGVFSATATSMNRARAYHTATLLSDGRVLIVGGTDGTSVSGSAELYDPEASAFLPSFAELNTARKTHAAILLANDTVLILGGTDGTNILSSAEIYDPILDAFSKSSNSMNHARNNFTATFLIGGTEGYLRAQSTQGLTFSEVYGGANDTAVSNGIDMSRFSGIYVLYSPQFATVPGFKTILNVINGNESAAEITIALHNPDGSVIGNPVGVTLAPGAQLKDDLMAIFNNDPNVQNASGWLEIGTTVDLVVGTVSFTNADDVFLTSFELQGTSLTDFLFPLAAQDGTYLTGLSFLNANAETAVISMELWLPDGTLYMSSAVSLSPGNRTARYLNQFFPNLGSLSVANVRIHADKPIFGFGLLHDSGAHFISALPAIPILSGK